LAEAGSEPVLAVVGLTKRYGALTVTDRVHLAVQTGCIHAVIGPNGAGKTSLMQQISGFVRQDAGQVLLRGHDITRLAPHRRARLGLARSFQVTAVLPEMSTVENVALAARSAAGARWGFIRPAARDERFVRNAEVLLDRVGLVDRAAQAAGRLSHGERRQLELAAALALRPSVLLLDEPLAGAGPEETPRLVALLDGLRRDCAVLLIEHDMAAVFALADTISVLDQGRVIASGPPAAIRDDPAVRAAYLGETL
jgi:branched-chain amino acid transport system ATP-binding protein